MLNWEEPVRRNVRLITPSTANMNVSVLIFFSSFSILFPFVTGIRFYKKQSTAIRTFFWLICISVASEIILNYTSEKSINNLPFVNLFPAIELSFFGLFFWFLFQNPLVRKIIAACIVLFLLYWVISTWTYGFFFLNKFNFIFERIILIVLSGFYLIEVIKKTEQSPLRFASFNISAGAFIYFTSTIILFSFAQILQNEQLRNTQKYMSQYHAMINIFTNLIYSASFCAKYRE